MAGKIIHQIATCTVCGKQWEDYENSKAYKLAYSHAQYTGHKVTGQTGTAWTIIPK